jgi:TAT (twin-arginine translocation) pathway signal sequence
MTQLTRRDFLHSSALTAAAVTFPGLGRRAQAVATSDLEASAHNAYSNLRTLFTADENFWRLGNAFDTLTDYLVLARNRYDDTRDSDIGDIVSRAFQKYQDTQSGPDGACWYDDYGWWGIASVKAYDPAFAKIFAATSESFVGRFRQVALQSWDTVHRGKHDGVHKGAPRVFENRDNQSQFDPQPGPPLSPRSSGRHGLRGRLAVRPVPERAGGLRRMEMEGPGRV